MDRLFQDKHSSLVRTLVNYGRTKFYDIGPRYAVISCLCYKYMMTIVSDDHKWHLHYKCVIALALVLASVVNYDCKICHNVDRLLLLKSIYNKNIFLTNENIFCEHNRQRQAKTIINLFKNAIFALKNIILPLLSSLL